jgi:hypothetical protein
MEKKILIHNKACNTRKKQKKRLERKELAKKN